MSVFYSVRYVFNLGQMIDTSNNLIIDKNMRKLYSSLLFMTICGSLSAQRSQVMQSDDTTFSAIKQLQEVTITAEKRELSISEIPVALSVISGKNLLNENTPDLRNLSGMIPNFYMQEGVLNGSQLHS